MADLDDNDENVLWLRVEPKMIWGTTIEDGTFRLYINEEEYIDFNREAAVAIYKAIRSYAESIAGGGSK